MKVDLGFIIFASFSAGYFLANGLVIAAALEAFCGFALFVPILKEISVLRESAR